MSPTEQQPRKESTPKGTRGGARSFDFVDVVKRLRSGESGKDLEKAQETFGLFTAEKRQPLIQHLVEQEGCSPAFAERFLTDAAFRKRVNSAAEQFSGHGEQMLKLEEAEIYTELFEPNADHLDPVMERSNPQTHFKNLVPVEREGLRTVRLDDLKKQLDATEDAEARGSWETVLRHSLGEVGVEYNGSEKQWDDIIANQQIIDRLSAIPAFQQFYETMSKGKKLQYIGRKIEMAWRMTPDGKRIPMMHVFQAATHPETGYVSELGFTIEKQPAGERTGEGERRVLKDMVIITDASARGKGEGGQFLLKNLELVRAYRLHDAEFNANIKIGSYNWARIADVDPLQMSELLSSKAKGELPPKPWGDKQMRQAKAVVYRELILPHFEKNMAIAIASVLNSITDPGEKEATSRILAEDLMQKRYEALKAKALAGDLTMEELVSLGKGVEVFRFDREGAVVAPNAPDAVNEGHLGKAAIMGIPWKARMELNRTSMFQVVDRLNRGTGFLSSLKKSGMKIGLALSL